MRLILIGCTMAATGLGLLLGQTMRAMTPSIPLALGAFALAFLGILIGVVGIIRRA
jgi:hypothetical protein